MLQVRENQCKHQFRSRYADYVRYSNYGMTSNEGPVKEGRFARMQSVFEMCKLLGGSLYEAKAHMTAYFQRSLGSATSTEIWSTLVFLNSFSGPEHGQGFEVSTRSSNSSENHFIFRYRGPTRLSSSLCAPEVCGAEDLRRLAVQIFASQLDRYSTPAAFAED